MDDHGLTAVQGLQLQPQHAGDRKPHAHAATEVDQSVEDFGAIGEDLELDLLASRRVVGQPDSGVELLPLAPEVVLDAAVSGGRIVVPVSYTHLRAHETRHDL